MIILPSEEEYSFNIEPLSSESRINRLTSSVGERPDFEIDIDRLSSTHFISGLQVRTGYNSVRLSSLKYTGIVNDFRVCPEEVDAPVECRSGKSYARDASVTVGPSFDRICLNKTRYRTRIDSLNTNEIFLEVLGFIGVFPARGLYDLAITTHTRVTLPMLFCKSATEIQAEGQPVFESIEKLKGKGRTLLAFQPETVEVDLPFTPGLSWIGHISSLPGVVISEIVPVTGQSGPFSIEIEVSFEIKALNSRGAAYRLNVINECWPLSENLRVLNSSCKINSLQVYPGHSIDKLPRATSEHGFSQVLEEPGIVNTNIQTLRNINHRCGIDINKYGTEIHLYKLSARFVNLTLTIEAEKLKKYIIKGDRLIPI